jgi:hypothetical protein
MIGYDRIPLTSARDRDIHNTCARLYLYAGVSITKSTPCASKEGGGGIGDIDIAIAPQERSTPPSSSCLMGGRMAYGRTS